MKNDGGPAFPATVAGEGDPAWPCRDSRDGGRLVSDAYEAPGMSLRDYMATHIISGVLANHLTVLSNKDPMGSIKTLCATAYLLADSLLEARDKTDQTV